MEKTATDKRDPFFDNIKGLLILLVVSGHYMTIALRGKSIIFQGIYALIYSFHMPLFIAVSGYFHKGRSAERQGQAVHRLLFQYLFASLLVFLAKSISAGKVASMNLVSPPFGTWYLLSLLLIICVYPWVSGIRASIIVSVVVALLVGFVDRIDAFLSLSRTVCLLPFFLIGAIFLDKSKIDALRSLKPWKKALFIIVCLIIAAVFLFGMYKCKMNFEIVWLKKSYKKAGMTAIRGLIARAGMYLTAIAVGTVIFMTMTKRECFLTKWGRNSLSIYILHLPLYYLVSFIIKKLPSKNIWLILAVTLIAIIGVVILLSRDFVNRGLKGLFSAIEKITWKGAKNEQK